MSCWKKALAAGLVMLCLVFPAAAAQSGEIEVVLPGGSLTAYRIDARFEDIAPEKLALTAQEAEELAEYARIYGITGITRGISLSGTVRFSGLAEGIYLLVQQEVAEGYFPVRPFLVRLYGGADTVSAKPKTEKLPVEESPGTGDGFSGLAVAALAVSLLGLGGCVIQRRRR